MTPATTSAPDKMTIETSPPFVLLREAENKRPVFAVRNMPDSQAMCVRCEKTADTEVFVGIQYTYDAKKFSALCVPCAQDMGIVSTTTEGTAMTKPDTTEETPKRKRGRPPGSGKHQKVAAQAAQDETGEENMGLLKSKLAVKTATVAPVATPEEKVTTLITGDESLELDEEDVASDGIEIDEAPWKEETPAKIDTTTNGKKADTPADLRSRIENVDVPKATATGLTKADVQDIVQACLVDTVKALTTTIKEIKAEIKTEVNKALSAVQADVREQVKTVMEHVNTVGVSLDALTKKLDAALSDDEEPTATVSAPAITITATNTTAGAEAKKATKPAPKAPASTLRPVFADFVAEQVGTNGVRLEPLADMLMEMGYFKTAPDDREQFLSNLTTLLRQRGYKVVDFFVTKAE